MLKGNIFLPKYILPSPFFQAHDNSVQTNTAFMDLSSDIEGKFKLSGLDRRTKTSINWPWPAQWTQHQWHESIVQLRGSWEYTNTEHVIGTSLLTSITDTISKQTEANRNWITVFSTLGYMSGALSALFQHARQCTVLVRLMSKHVFLVTNKKQKWKHSLIMI